MKFVDRIKPEMTGLIEIKKDGVIVFQEENLVVTNHRGMLRGLMYGDQVPLNGLLMGDCGHKTTGYVPDPPALTDVTLLQQLYTHTPDSITKITEGTRPAIEYYFLLPKENYNDAGIFYLSEVGLSNDGENLFTRKTFKAIEKTANSQLEITYKLIF